jgi:branched-subunit amino acid transport protein AzlD
MMDNVYALGVMAAMAGVTFALRALPFLGAQWLQKHPFVYRLGQFLPLAIMTLLLLHALVGAASEHAHGPWFELVAVVTVIALQWRLKNALLSMLIGGSIYVLLRNWQF